jgi:hypothetical protein
MDAATSERHFDPCLTTKFTGRGLGMAAVLEIVRGHKRAIRVNGEVSRGTTIRVLSPTPAEGSRATAAASLRQEAHSAGAAAKGSAILVVEDEDAVRKVAIDYVSRLGFRAFNARDGREALQVFRQHADEAVCVLLGLTMGHERLGRPSVLRRAGLPI